MTIWLKEGVHGHLEPPMRRLKGYVADVYGQLGYDLQITSKCDGNHCAGSCHYEGNAIDFKRQNVQMEIIRTVANGVAELYGYKPEDFDIVEYDDERDIFHVEFDKK